MLDVQIYHKTSKDAVASITDEGLKYGEQGRHSQEDHAQRTNRFLDKLCPDELRSRGVDRQRCTYCYLCVDGKVFDVDSGATVERESWDVGADSVILRLTVDPGVAFVGDLDAYDELAKRIEDDADEGELEERAQRYWQRFLNLSDLLAHYRLEDGALVVRGSPPPGLPARLERIEVLLTADVPSEHIHQA